jgi:MFS family permease
MADMSASEILSPPFSSDGESLPLVQADSSSSAVVVSSRSGTVSYLSLLFCTVCLSIDYSVIMPSLWLFLRSIDPDVNEAFLGVALAIFQLASVLLNPLFGYWLDSRPMKEVIVFQLWISILGNLAYSFSTSVWQIIVSRFFCGAGSCVGLCANIYVIRATTEKERSRFYWRNILF